MENTTKSEKNSFIWTFISWTLVAFWALLIFFMSANTGSNLNNDLGFFSQLFQQFKVIQESIFGPGVDIASSFAHFCEYLIFGLLLANALRLRVSLKNACLLAIVLASLYGITDEFHQYFVPERVCDPLDWLVDTLGASVGSGLAYLVFHKGTKK